MSFLKKLFGGGGEGGAGKAPSPTADAEHKGCTIVAMPMEDAGQYRLSGIIRKEIGGETREHWLIRADVFPDRDAATTATIDKARRVIDEQGDALFAD